MFCSYEFRIVWNFAINSTERWVVRRRTPVTAMASSHQQNAQERVLCDDCMRCKKELNITDCRTDRQPWRRASFYKPRPSTVMTPRGRLTINTGQLIYEGVTLDSQFIWPRKSPRRRGTSYTHHTEGTTTIGRFWAASTNRSGRFSLSSSALYFRPSNQTRKR